MVGPSLNVKNEFSARRKNVSQNFDDDCFDFLGCPFNCRFGGNFEFELWRQCSDPTERRDNRDLQCRRWTDDV
jgi:hypothetical protein